MLGLVGTDVNSGMARYTFGVMELYDGIGFTVIVVGLFAVAEVVGNLESKEVREVFAKKIGSLMPTRKDVRDSAWPTMRGTAVGSLFGVLPGTGPALSSFVTYMLEKKIAADPSRFGKGAIEGVAAPEAANNAGAQTSFVPTPTLGLPSNPLMALLIGIWVSLLRVPYCMLFPASVVFCAIGAYSIGNSLFDLWLMLGFGLIGYFFIKIGVEP